MPLIFEGMESQVFKFKKYDDYIHELHSLLNVYCEFRHNDDWKKGQLVSFDEDVVTFKTDTEGNIDIFAKDYKDNTRNFVEDIEDLSFAITIY